MSFRVIAYGPAGTAHALSPPWGVERPEWALQDRDNHRESFFGASKLGYRIEAVDSTGRVMEWDDLATSVTVGDAA